jgi:hypothetical protein
MMAQAEPEPAEPDDLTKSQRIDLGLAILEATSKPGTAHTLAEIAAYCDRSVNNIVIIQRKALRKLRRALKKALESR